jgi:DNA-binding SARP family transcriptional activator
MEESAPGRPVEGQIGWQTTGELLKAGQYDRVAELLHEARVTSEDAGDAILAKILAAAHEICRACSLSREEMEWHQRGQEEAVRRKRKLERQLQEILDVISRYSAPRPIATAEVNPPQHKVPESVERPTPWQRIQSLLGRRSDPQSSGRVAPIPWAPGEAGASSGASPDNKERGDPPSLAVNCLGPFRIYLDDKIVTNWASGKGKAIFKYMVGNRGRPILKDILMDVFWRNADPEAARNNLNVAIYGLRQALRAARPDFPYILFQNGQYLVNPDMVVWADFEQFIQQYEAGQRLERRGKLAEALSEYETAESLYRGDFLEEDLYEDWTIPQRERLRDSYLMILDRLSRYYLEEKKYGTCIQLCQKILVKDECREDIHRRLMRCYSRQGQRSLALRQHTMCVDALSRVLDISPMQETVTLYEQIRNREVVDV